ncbi:hypothetical protein Tco_0998821 [Tanacetum coccineum]
MERSNASLSQEDWSWVDYHIQQKLDSLYKIKEELELDLIKSLEEQDPIIKLNLLARKKRKNVDDLHDYFKSSKGYKKSVQCGDFQTGTVLNEPTLGMILFNSKQAALKILKN